MSVLTTERSTALAHFYAHTAARVRRRVERSAHADAPVIDDACQDAWAILMRRPDITLDDRGTAWLVTVAARLAWKKAIPRDIAVGAFRGAWGDPEEMPEPVADDPPCDDQALGRVEHARRLQLLAQLPRVEREALFLQALDYSYQEIARVMDSNLGAVNHHIHRGRRQIVDGR